MSTADEVARASLILETHLDEAFLVRSAQRAAASVNGILSSVIGTGAGSRGFQNLARAGQQLTTQFGALAAKAGPVGIAIAGVAAAAIAASIAIPKLSQAIVRQAQLASNLNESLNATNVILGTQAAQFLKTFKASERLGVSQQDLLSNTAPVAAILREAGFTSEEFGEKLALLTQRAIDTSSVFNVEVAQVLQRFGGAIRGETRAVEALGIAFNAFEVEQKALALGFRRVNGEIEENGKQQARLALILEQSDKFAGDFVNTQFELANQQRVLRATVTELWTEISEQFLPAAKQIVATLIDLAREAGPELIQFFKDIKPLINFVADAFSAAAKGIDILITGVSKAKGAIAFLGGVFLRSTGAFGQFIKVALDGGDALKRFDFGGIADKFRGTMSLLEDINEEFIDITALLNDVESAQKSLTAATNDYNKALKGVLEAQENVNEAIRDGAEAVQDAIEAANEANERAIEGVVDATENLTEAQTHLNEVIAEGGEEELAEAREDLANSTDALADAEERRVDAAERLAELLAPATQQELANATDNITTAEISLARAIRKRDEALAALNATQEVAIDLSGLSLDGLRSTLANARATAAAQRAVTKTGKSQVELEEEAILAEIGVRDATQDVTEAKTTLRELELKGLVETPEITEARKDLANAEKDVAKAVREVNTDRTALQKIEAGESEFSKTLADARTTVAEAEERLAKANEEVGRTATEGQEAVAKAHEDANKRIADARDGVRDAEDRVTTALLAQRDAQQEINEKIATAIGDQETLLGLKLQQFAVNEDLIRQTPGLLESAIANVIASLPPLTQMTGGHGAPGAQARVQLLKGINDLLRDPNLPFAEAFRRLGLPGFGAEGALIEGASGPLGKLMHVGEFGRPELILPLTKPNRVWELLSKNLPRFPAAQAAAVSAVSGGARVPKISIAGAGGAASSAQRKANKDLAVAIAQELVAAGLTKGGDTSITIPVTTPQPDPRLLAREIDRRISKNRR